MSRRAPKAELAFGSDSFLDVVCNIVGILIILILIASYHASNAPVTAEMIQELSTEEFPAPTLPDASLPTPDRDVPILGPLAIEPPERATTVPVRPPDLPLSPKLVTQRERLQAEIKDLGAETQAADARLRELAEASRRAVTRAEVVSTTVVAERDDAGKRRELVAALSASLDDSKRDLQLLQENIKDAEEQKTPVNPIKHRVTPISKTVLGKEVHFRLAENRVALVPVDELSERLRPQIERRKEMLIKYRRQEGEVGPVSGFSMRYAVERDPISVVDELRGGRGVMRISVSRWEIVPEPELHTETADEALRRGSAFLRSVKMADVDGTLTFWVYPDSFDIFRRLRDFAYEEGFTVAARPLPHGVPISGSPQGSKSAGQ